MDSPLALTAMILWLLLIGLMVRQCRKWLKEQNKQKVIYQNHPAIPVKVYTLSDFTEQEKRPMRQPVIRKAATKQSAPPNAWDV